MRIVFGDSSLARYRLGGGHWSVILQYLLGLRDLGHEVTLLELLLGSGDPDRDRRRIDAFFERLAGFGLREQSALLLFDGPGQPAGRKARMDDVIQDVDAAQPVGRTRSEINDIIAGADMLWNNCCGIRQPLLGMFRHRVLLDLDPGHLQVSALERNLDIGDHQTFLTVGTEIGRPDCGVPTLGVAWHAFLPFVHLPLWNAGPDPGADAPFSSVTHWAWGELTWNGRTLSLAKRDGYLPLAGLPCRCRRPFELAVRFSPGDTSGDRERLLNSGWTLVDPWEVAASPAAYQQYISRSRAEISCAKPIFTELRTGWFSDRSASYLASGRPVLAQETGISRHLPTGKGLLTFETFEEAVSGVGDIDADYPAHTRAARALAEEFLDGRRCLARMVAACN